MRVIKTIPKRLNKHIKLFYSIYASEFENVDCRLPDGTLDLVFNLGAPVMISRNGTDYLKMPNVVLTGLYKNRSYLKYSGVIRLVGVVFQPGSAQLFVNDTLENFKECTCDASAIFGNNINSVMQKLQEKENDEAMHLLLENYLIDIFNKNNSSNFNSAVAIATKQIEDLEGNIEIFDIYKKLGVSERSFRRNFTQNVGMSPKQYSLLIRVKSFSKRYELKDSFSLEVMYDLGYNDRSHFNKEFKKIVGHTPSNYFAHLSKLGSEYIHLI